MMLASKGKAQLIAWPLRLGGQFNAVGIRSKNPLFKTRYSASMQSLGHSGRWSPWSALAGLIWRGHLLGTQRVRKHGRNLWKR